MDDSRKDAAGSRRECGPGAPPHLKFSGAGPNAPRPVPSLVPQSPAAASGGRWQC